MARPRKDTRAIFSASSEGHFPEEYLREERGTFSSSDILEEERFSREVMAENFDAIVGKAQTAED